LRFIVTIVSVARFLPCELACRADQGRSGFFPLRFFGLPFVVRNAEPDGQHAHRQSALNRS
jgi:hypothetical protein